MLSTTGLVLLTTVSAYVLNVVLPWVKNIRIARSTGLPYVAVPYYCYNRLTSLFWVRVLLRPWTKYLGKPSPISWRTLVTGNWPWTYRHDPFAMLASDSFVTAAPGGFLFHTADADVIAQILSRPTDFRKASHLYRPVGIYGENVLSTEGATWRYHRRLTSSMFGESNNQLVWKQSLRDGQSMLSAWLHSQGEAITTLARDTMLLSLSVIGHAGLGQTVQWPSASAISSQTLQERDNIKPPARHQMTFTVALTTLIGSIYYIVLLPKWFLRIAPSRAARRSYQSYLEWQQYMHEIIASKREALADAKSSAGPVPNDFLTRLLKEHEPSKSTVTKSKVDPDTRNSHRLSDSEILGNLFIMVIAGHETSANSIHFCLALLAMYPHIQREVQLDLDEIFLSRASTEEWDYERDLPSLLNSELAAVLNEELRLLPAAIVIPKYTTKPQTLTVNGRDVTIPAKTMMRICVPSVHRNPNCWAASTGGAESPSPRSDSATAANDLDTFRPSRWFSPVSDPTSVSTSGGPPAHSWVNPPKGAYVPFSDGARACLGRRFAQVEILVVLALILWKYSIELDFDEPETGGPEKVREAWSQAKADAEYKLREKMGVVITLQLQKGHSIPVKIVERGKERMKDLI